MTRSITALFLVAELAVTAGKSPDALRFSWLRDGRTSQGEVLRRIGPPLHRYLDDGGAPTWSYEYLEYRSPCESGSLRLVVHFTAGGVVKSHALSAAPADGAAR